MSSNIKIIISVFLALAIGLAGGFIFGKKQGAELVDTSKHQHSDTANTPTASTEEEIWVCSMHPQIRQNEPGICPICEMDLTPLEANTSDDPLVLQMTESAVKLSNIQTSIVGQSSGKDAINKIELSGRIEADERLASSQVTHVSGRIEKLFVTYTGARVRKGQKVASIYSPELITAQRELLEALKLQDLNPALVEAARNKLRFWKIGKSTIEGIEKEGKIIETFGVYADQSGIVTNRRVSVGDYVQKGNALFDLMNLNKVWVVFDAYEEDLENISIGDEITFSTPAIPNKNFTSKVTFIDPLLNPQTRTVAIRTEVTNTKALLKPEMLVTGMLKSTNKKAINTPLNVPKSAVMWTGKRSVVYVKVPDMEIPSFQFREVELGNALGSNYQVLEGLEADEEVVTYGSFTIDAAAQLNNQASMMNREVQLKKEDEGGIPNFQVETPDAFKEQLNDLANAYIELKDAFVATDAPSAAKVAETVVAKIEAIDMALLKGDAHIYWMEQLEALQAHSKNIVEEKEDVEAQRKQFGFVSDALINAIEAFGTKGNALYVQHCPMAFDNEGGDWLALEEQIQNPYFGDKMMKCGLVKKVYE